MFRFKSLNSAAGNAGAEIEFVGATSASSTSSPSLSGITGLQEGDLVITYATRDSNSFTLSSSGWSGWTVNFPNNNSNSSITNIPAYKIMGATVDTGQSYTAVVQMWTAIAFRNATVDSPVVISFLTGTGASQSPPSISIATEGSGLVQLCAIDDDISTLTPSTGYTKAAEAQTNRRGSNALAYKLGLSAGTETPGSFSWSTSDSLLYRALRIIPSS
jgi:hypothetical protein